jgi:predicted nucleotidyltransferase
MDEIKIPLLPQAVDRLVHEFNPEKIFLFGSHAWGTPHADSDVDILVIINSSDLPPTRRAAKAYRCLQGLKIPVEIIVSTQQEVEKYRSVPSSLSHKILEKGRMIYG